MYEEALLDPKSVEELHKLRNFAPQEYGALERDIRTAKRVAWGSLAGVGLILLGAIAIHYRRQMAPPAPPPAAPKTA